MNQSAKLTNYQTTETTIKLQRFILHKSPIFSYFSGCEELSSSGDAETVWCFHSKQCEHKHTLTYMMWFMIYWHQWKAHGRSPALRFRNLYSNLFYNIWTKGLRMSKDSSEKCRAGVFSPRPPTKTINLRPPPPLNLWKDTEMAGVLK